MASFCFHEIGENVIDPRQMAFPLRFQPFDDSRIKAHAYRHFWSNVAQAHHFLELLAGQAWDITIVYARIIAPSLPRGNTADSIEFSLRPAPAPDIFGCHAFPLPAPR